MHVRVQVPGLPDPVPDAVLAHGDVDAKAARGHGSGPGAHICRLSH